MKPQFNKIFNVDCLTGMKRLADESIDMILADPPYVISRPSQFGTMPDRENSRTGTDFGEWDKAFNNQPWLKAACRILKKGGSLIVFNDVKKVSTIIQQAEKAGFVYKDTIVWHKTNPMPRNINRRYVSDIEIAIWFVKPGKTWVFNRIDDPYMSCVKTTAVESGGGFERIHPTQKPLRLFESFIKTHSNKGDLILDPFMGSGTTAIAAHKNGRAFIGFEISNEYFEKSLNRLRKNKIDV